jgi:hypothetical protein
MGVKELNIFLVGVKCGSAPLPQAYGRGAWP